MFTLNCKGKLVSITQPIVMGILNLTPDSFFAGSRVKNFDELLSRAEEMIKHGATILDVGGQSTRPGSNKVMKEVELERVLPAVEALHKNFPEQLISIDTFDASVAAAAVNAGASIVNDVSGGSFDETLLSTVARLQVPYVLMHIKGTPQNMQEQPAYENVTSEVFDVLSFKINELTRMGIHDIIIDPGFGFGKTIAHNFTLLKTLSFFTQLGKPILAGLSRKATVYKTLHTTADKALNGTTAIHTIALMNGANILRVHDVKEAKEAINIFVAYQK